MANPGLVYGRREEFDGTAQMLRVRWEVRRGLQESVVNLMSFVACGLAAIQTQRRQRASAIDRAIYPEGKDIIEFDRMLANEMKPSAWMSWDVIRNGF